jgi:hypothetical protein
MSNGAAEPHQPVKGSNCDIRSFFSRCSVGPEKFPMPFTERLFCIQMLQENIGMKAMCLLGLGVCGAMLISTGCRKTNAVDKMAFKSAINNYYSTRQDCVWPSAVKFPVQADTSNYEQTKGYDALTDAGFLIRKAEEKKRFLIGSKQVNDYDVSDKGRSNWTVDQTQPGYGNFCFGHREVTTIDGFTPADVPDATQYTVSYHYDVANVPGWASTVEMKTAFPKVALATSGQQTAVANVVKSDSGWQVNSVTPAD